MAVIDFSKITRRSTVSHELSTSVPGWRRQVAWRLKGIGILRIAFGIVWAIDAWLKWRPGSDFFRNFTGHVEMASDGQPPLIQVWIHGWMQVIHYLNPYFCARLIGITEVALAVGLIFGMLSNLTYAVGILLSLMIWTTAEGFGGPYNSSNVDIGAAIIYVLVFTGLFLSSAGLYIGVDRYLAPGLGRWGFLASSPIKADESNAEDVLAKAKNRALPVNGKTQRNAKNIALSANGRSRRKAKNVVPPVSGKTRRKAKNRVLHRSR